MRVSFTYLGQGAAIDASRAVDYLGNTAGDIALSLNDEESYRIIRDAGIRSGTSCTSYTFTLLKLLVTEFLLHVLSSKSSIPPTVVWSVDDGPFGSTAAFMKSKLFFSHDARGQEICNVISDGETMGVMMGWERPISTCFRSKAPVDVTTVNISGVYRD